MRFTWLPPRTCSPRPGRCCGQAAGSPSSPTAPRSGSSRSRGRGLSAAAWNSGWGPGWDPAAAPMPSPDLPGGGIAVIANGTPLWQQPVPWSRAVRRGLEQWLGTRLESCCGTDAQSRQRYQSALLAAGFNGVHEQSLDYTGHLSFDELIGGLYSAMPSHLLPPPAQRAAFTDHIRNAIGAGDQFTEQVHLAALVGYSPPPPSAH